MKSFFHKDLLVYWRDRKEIAISLITPIVIIIVLGFALPGWVENPTESLEMKVAIVNVDDEAAALQKFRDTLSSQQLTEEARLAAEQRLEIVSPVHLLTQLFQNEQVKGFISVTELDYAEAVQQLQENKITAIISIPEGFTLAAVNKMLLGTGNGATLNIFAEESSLQVGVLTNLIDNFLHTINYQAAMEQLLEIRGAASAEIMHELAVKAANDEVGGRETIPGVQMVTSFQYYTLAISIVFILLMSTTVAAKAITEKRERIFNRILLANSQSFQYLLGKFSSTVLLSISQVSIILIVSHFVLNVFPNRSFHFWIGMAVVFFMLALCVGALSSFFTALVFRIDAQAASGLTFLITLIAGTIGGSFVPIYALPSWLKAAGEWTPNGMTLAVLLKWLQSETINDLTFAFIMLAVFTIVTLSAAIWIFPRRGRIS